jgi:RNA polymerase sigma factor for flagellar operon FliA
MTKTASAAYRNALLQQRRDELVLENLEFVRHVLGKLALNLPAIVDIENLESAGILGLVEAAQHFDAGRGVAFRTFAYPRVRGAIIDELRRNCPLPQQVLQHVALVRKACESLEPPVTPEQIAQTSSLSVEQVESCLEAIRLTRPTEWDDSLFHHGMQHTSQPSTTASIEREETKQVLADCIEQLPDQERIVLTLYHWEDLRLKEIGNVLNLSESRISRILAKAEFRLGAAVRERGG